MQIKKKVLVVDDDEMHLFTTKELLENDRLEVITHKSWFGVTHRVNQLEPDLVLLDVNMPGLSGDRLARLLKPSQSPIVFHSSNDEDSLRQLVRAHGVRGYICKGDIISLRNKVNEYLGFPG